MNLLKKHILKILIIITGTGIVLAAGLGGNGEPIIPSIDFNGKIIEFPYTDDNTGENLIIRTDKEVYSDSRYVYAMVENKSGKNQDINLQLFFEDESRGFSEIYKLSEDVSYEVDVPDYKTVDYDCSTVTSTETCQRQEQTGTHKKTKYKDEWQPQNMSVFSNKDNADLIEAKDIKEKDKKGFIAKSKVANHLPNNEISYFKIKIDFPPWTMNEFFIEAIGSKGGYGLLK